MITEGYETLDCQVIEHCLKLTLNRPAKLNAMNDLMRAELVAALRDAGEDPSVRAVVIRGAGGNLCAGGDVNDMGTGSGGTAARVLRGARVIEAMASLPKPIICAVEGYATGAGFSMALSSDIVVATPDAKFRMVFIQRGLLPDMGAGYFLPRQVGLMRAKEIAMTGRVVEASEAHSLGIVAHIWQPAEFDERLHKYATDLANGPTLALGGTRRIMGRSFESSLSTSLELEGFLQPGLGVSEDHISSVAAFKEKRPPVFHGR